eukprot:jgi/Mesen1/4810/ME000243S03990
MVSQHNSQKGEDGRRPTISRLPVEQVRSLIVTKVRENLVTMVYGRTGSGKSSQVPQFLLEIGPVLCTQPRRLAVVSVARRVAEERGTILGEDVGYQIGQRNLRHRKCKITFVTAGILLEELRANGIDALKPFKVVVLDEVHERSVESDLVLACMKQLMLRHPTMRLVLMSATADFNRYGDYFKVVQSGENLQRIAIPDYSTSLQSVLFDSRVRYLEQVVAELGNEPKHAASVARQLSSSFSGDMDVTLDFGAQELIRDLILHIHQSDADVHKSVLVFMPTYKTLEELRLLLSASELQLQLQLYVLHSSIDMDTCIEAMEAGHSKRKVILATNIAESSVTVPGVAYVIDTCRSLQLSWSPLACRHLPKLIWASQSQLDQRKGRTGRTCDSTVYRMIPRTWVQRLQKHDTPALQLQSLRREVLILAAADSKVISDAATLLARCMDPPEERTIFDALEYLTAIKAVSEPGPKRRGKLAATYYGRLLASMPLSMEASLLVVAGGHRGLLREASILAAIVGITPFPIVTPFGQKAEHHEYVDAYFEMAARPKGSVKRLMLPSSPISTPLNFGSALGRTSSEPMQSKRATITPGVPPACQSKGTRIESSASERMRARGAGTTTCRRHHGGGPQVPADVLAALRRSAALLLCRARPRVPYRAHARRRAPAGACAGALRKGARRDDVRPEHRCAARPFVLPHAYHNAGFEEEISALLKEAWIDKAQAQAARADELLLLLERQHLQAAPHRTPRTPLCKFFATRRGCRNGRQCAYLHVLPQTMPDTSYLNEDMRALAPTREDLDSLCLALAPPGSRERLLLLGEGDFSFALALVEQGLLHGSSLIASSIDSREAALAKYHALSLRLQMLEDDVEVLFGLDATSLGNLRSLGPVERAGGASWQRAPGWGHVIEWSRVSRVLWNFPFLETDEDSGGHRRLMESLFCAMSVPFMLLMPPHSTLMLTLFNDQFSRWQVERTARDHFFFLERAIPFDSSSFSGYNPVRNDSTHLFATARPVSYLFSVGRRADIQLKQELVL